MSENTLPNTPLPWVIAGPIVRHVSEQQANFWLVTSKPITEQSECLLKFSVNDSHDDASHCVALDGSVCQTIQVGRHAYIHLITITTQLPLNTLIYYDFLLVSDNQKAYLSALCPELLYEQQSQFSFMVQKQISSMLHGSCRNPHHFSDDALIRADVAVAESFSQAVERPALLMMSGDQIYADDVSGPTLVAIHQLISLLGLHDEVLDSEHVDSGSALYQHPDTLYQRLNLLPTITMPARWFGVGRSLPIFSSRFCDNHLITLAEVIAMYLLVWSPSLWRCVDFNKATVPAAKQQRWQKEKRQINRFVTGLSSVQRALAHLPTYMIFDDHDVTDDWNLTAQWEQAVYSNPIGKQTIGNTLIGYWLCQGWGNMPTDFSAKFVEQVKNTIEQPSLDSASHGALINLMLDFEQWHYSLDTEPALIVLDTRTQRWRSERRLGKPSGLMDWEALCELQQQLIGKKSVILVSAAPIFGLKLIEAIQHFVTALGFPLAVDAENWMAHSGSGNTLMQIFTHLKTPQNFVILSGDVHYSFVYDIKLYFRKSSPDIWQITCSGIKNEFPQTLLAVFDWLNRWLYAPYSPLNWFTKRRAMKIKPRKPSSVQHRHSVSKSGLGYLAVDNNGAPTSIQVLTADGNAIDFIKRKDDE